MRQGYSVIERRRPSQIAVRARSSCGLLRVQLVKRGRLVFQFDAEAADGRSHNFLPRLGVPRLSTEKIANPCRQNLVNSAVLPP